MSLKSCGSLYAEQTWPTARVGQFAKRPTLCHQGTRNFWELDARRNRALGLQGCCFVHIADATATATAALHNNTALIAQETSQPWSRLHSCPESCQQAASRVACAKKL